jgi:hypothetical protein
VVMAPPCGAGGPLWVTAGAARDPHYSGFMPSASVDPERLLALSRALAPLRETSREGAETLLGHFVETGEREAQTAVDAFLEQAADTLRAIDAVASELASRLRIAAQSAETTEHRAAQSVEGTRSVEATQSADPTERRGLFQ